MNPTGEVSWAIYNWEWIFLVTLPKNKLHTSHSYTGSDNSFCSHLLARLSICVYSIFVWRRKGLCVARRAYRGVCVCVPALACLAWSQSELLDLSELLISPKPSLLSKQRRLRSLFNPCSHWTITDTQANTSMWRLRSHMHVNKNFFFLSESQLKHLKTNTYIPNVIVKTAF